MKILGFNFTKETIERLKDEVDELKIDSRINIEEIKPLKVDILKDHGEVLKVEFIYSIKYEPEFAVIELKGNIILSLEEEKFKEVLKEWKKKKMPDDFRITLFNIILKKASVKAMTLEDDLDIPTHIPLPLVRPNEPQKE